MPEIGISNCKGRAMKKITSPDGLDLLDWVLSIDFDPVEIIRVRCDMQTTCASIGQKSY
jgi:hypothetical protein